MSLREAAGSDEDTVPDGPGHRTEKGRVALSVKNNDTHFINASYVRRALLLGFDKRARRACTFPRVQNTTGAWLWMWRELRTAPGFNVTKCCTRSRLVG